MDLGAELDDDPAASEWAVPSTALAHALRTPLNVLKGYAVLLASGELGRLDADALAAAVEMREAVAELERTVGLLARLPGPAPTGALDLDLGALIASALTRRGFVVEGGDALTLGAVDWCGWRDLVGALVHMCVAEGAGRIDVRADGANVTWQAAAPRAGGGDGRLAAFAAQRRAAAGGLALRLPATGGAVMEGRGLMSGAGRTTYVADDTNA